MSAKAMSQLLQNNKLVMSRDSRMTLIKHDVIYEYGGISRGGGTNMIGLIALSIAFGAVLNIIKEDGLPLVNLFRSLWTASMKLVEIIMWYVAYKSQSHAQFEFTSENFVRNQSAR
jgi:Na+/H+-dicarboxylate symporter